MGAERLGVVGLHVYAFAALFSSAAMNIGLVAMVLACVLSWRSAWHSWRRRPVFWLSLAFAAYVVARAYLGIAEFPLTRVDQVGAMSDLLMVGGLPMLIAGMWTGGKARRINRILALALGGFLVLMTLKGGWQSLLAPATQRLTLDMSPNALGLIAATLLLGCLAYLLSTLACGGRLLITVGLAAAVLVTSLTLVMTGARGAWIAALVVLPVSMPLLGWQLLPPTKRGAGLLGLLGGTMILAAVISWVGSDMLGNRIAAMHAASTDIAAQGTQNVSDTSISARLLMWQEGTRLLSERPLLGWGPGSAPHLLQHAPQERIQEYRHFHSLPLTLLVTLGVCGTTLFLALHAAILTEAWQAYRRGALTAEIFCLTAGGFAMFHITNLFQFRINGTAGQALITIIGMIALSALPPDRSPQTPQAKP